MTSARAAQRAWEDTWINGPSESPLDTLMDELPSMSLSDIEKEIALIETGLETPGISPRSRRQGELVLRFLRPYAEEREESLRTALESEDQSYLAQFTTPCPTELAIMAEYQEEKS